MSENTGIVLCISSHPVDLHDGRTLGPGEWAKNVELDENHNKVLLEDGHLVVLDVEPVITPRTESGEAPAPAPTPPTPTPDHEPTPDGGSK